MNRVRWTPDEDSYIFDTAGCPIGYVAETLGRIVRAVANRRLVVASATRDSDDRPMEGRKWDVHAKSALVMGHLTSTRRLAMELGRSPGSIRSMRSRMRSSRTPM